MLNININYPYPVIREYTDDYQSTEFIGELKVLLEPDGYAVHTNFEINNKGIQILLSKRILTYALEVQCVSTWFRKLYTIHENRVIRLDPQMIHERVELIPCIVVATSIEGFTNEDFAEEYQDMKFDLNAGDIIGIGQKRTFDPNVLSSDELNVIEGYFMNSQARKQNGAIFFPANGPSLIDKIYFEKHAIPYEYPVATTVVRKKKKIGRNEPCPCGSGKKFKKCCIEKGIYD